MATELPEPLLAYFAQREQQRAEAVDAVLASLTERERRLVREAAVMGYVQGRRHPADVDHPKDSAVLSLVIGECLANRDLYPVISGVRPCGECGHPQYAHREGDDPVSPGQCASCAEDDAWHDYQTPVEDPS